MSDINYAGMVPHDRHASLVLHDHDSAMGVKAGDRLPMDLLWNRVTANRHIELPAEILDVRQKYGCGQTGAQFKVMTSEGKATWLDAGWFGRK